MAGVLVREETIRRVFVSVATRGGFGQLPVVMSNKYNYLRHTQHVVLGDMSF